MALDDHVAGHGGDVFVDDGLILEKLEVRFEGGNVLPALAHGGLADCVAQDVAHVGDVLLERQGRGEFGGGDDFLPVLVLVFAQKLRREVQVGDLLFKHLLPDIAHLRAGLCLHTRPVEVALGVLVHEQALQPALTHVHEAAVLGNVLLLDHADLLIELAAQLCGIEAADVHIVVHRLLFGGGDDAHGQLRHGSASFPMGFLMESQGWR